MSDAMSLRAIKKRETQLNSTSNRQTLFKKSTLPQQRSKYQSASCNNNNRSFDTSTNSTDTIAYRYNPLHSLSEQRLLLGRSTHSNPELHDFDGALEQLVATEAHARLVRTKSESDVNTIFNSDKTDCNARGLVNAKSEICLETISSHNYNNYTSNETTTTNLPSPQRQSIQNPSNMYSRSHRELSHSAYNAGSYDTQELNLSPSLRRLSECSLNSSAGYSQRTSAISSSALTLSSNTTIDSNTVVRVPIIGYEVMEERARFTVYKLRVENSVTSWLVLRRYTDFVRLNTKLKQAFPHISLILPRKKIFGDNFNSVFLDNRVQGLQIFVNAVMSREELRKHKMVREFFCLDEPPTYSESMEECRAIFEAQEETIAHLKLQISNKNDFILSLQQKLREAIHEKDQIKQALKDTPYSCPRCNGSNNATSFN